jgi:hypothetical protein
MNDLLYPPSVEVNMNLKKQRLFVGDRWIDIGDVQIWQDKTGMHVVLPDFEVFLAQINDLDDGTFDWLEWGPRVN